MRNIIALTLFLLMSFSSFGSERHYKDFHHSNLNLSLCYNYSNYNEKLILHYKGVSSILNEYIIKKIEDCELENKVFNIEIGCKYFSGHPSIELTISKYNYYVFIHDLPSLQYLVQIIDYFSLPTWESFVIQAKDTDELMVKNERALEIFNKILNKNVPTVDMTFFKNRKVKVLELGDLNINYHCDSLQLEISNLKLGSDLNNPSPVNLKDRYIVVMNNNLNVYNSTGELINNIPLKIKEGHMDSEYRMVAYSKWINLYHYDKAIISYSYEKNKFYETKHENGHSHTRTCYNPDKHLRREKDTN
ncbi:MAG: hypothetical protein N4A72_17430 [Bacteroidales bacterium]|jgi:hypothetical protein|nr:hypothetical protein [Bacteroidales bacterium]